MSLSILWALVGLITLVTVIKRAIIGPQKQFARSFIYSFLLGFLILAQSSEPGDMSMWIGLAVIGFGVLMINAMFLVYMGWTCMSIYKHALAKNKRSK